MPNTYLDLNGYHIKKKKLDKKQLKDLKFNLTVTPENNNFGADEILYEQYVETEKEIIIPRFYGIEKYGIPDKTKFKPDKKIRI